MANIHPTAIVEDGANLGEGVLRFLCCCAPGYEHDDTVLVENE